MGNLPCYPSDNRSPAKTPKLLITALIDSRLTAPPFLDPVIDRLPGHPVDGMHQRATARLRRVGIR